MSPRTMISIEDPASIVAASVCWLSRWQGYGKDLVRPNHPAHCGWCDYPTEALLTAISAFDFTGWPARQFAGLPPSVRARLVAEAQGTADQPPLPEPPEPPPALDDEEAVPWV